MLQPKTLEKYQRVKDRHAKGETIQAALKAEGMGSATYWEAKKLEKAKATKKQTKPKTHTFVDMVQAPAPSQVAVIVCTPEQVRSVIAGLK